MLSSSELLFRLVLLHASCCSAALPGHGEHGTCVGEGGSSCSVRPGDPGDDVAALQTKRRRLAAPQLPGPQAPRLLQASAAQSGPEATACLPLGEDSYYHPASESELQCLILFAGEHGLQIRVRGSGHSVARVIFTDPCDQDDCAAGLGHEATGWEGGPNLQLMLDKYRSILSIDKERMLVTAQSGITLGASPDIPGATVENSLLKILADHGMTFDNLGGITHQTVSGFTSTGSQGGSLHYTDEKNLYGIRLIDGTGKIHNFSMEDADPQNFYAAGVAMGLFGIISEMTFKCTPLFAINGTQRVVEVADAPFDLFSEQPADGKMGLTEFLRSKDYPTMLYAPQPGVDRIQMWISERMPMTQDFVPKTLPDIPLQPVVAGMYTILGALDSLDTISPASLKSRFMPIFLESNKQIWDAISQALSGLLEEHVFHGEIPQNVSVELQELKSTAKALTDRVLVDPLVDAFCEQVYTFLKQYGPVLKKVEPQIVQGMFGLFFTATPEPEVFWEVSWRGLPKDNGANDIFMLTYFTEIWVPMSEGARCMQLLKDWWNAAETDQEKLSRTGTYIWELYPAPPSRFWMSNSYTNGTDVWKDGVFRIDVFWYGHNRIQGQYDFFLPVWELFRNNSVPFRLHWGKFGPLDAPPSLDGSLLAAMQCSGWREWLSGHREATDRFLALRDEMDPKNVFLNSLWRNRLLPGEVDC